MGCRSVQDSAVLSKTRPEITVPSPEELRALEAIVTRRTQILEMLTMERNRLGSTRDEAARASVQAVIEFLESQVEDLNAQMADRPARRAGPMGCRFAQDSAALSKNSSPCGLTQNSNL